MAQDMEHQEKLARVIDPESWKLHDNKDMKDRVNVKALLIKDSMNLAKRIIESGLMSDLEWDRREYLRAKDAIKRGTSRTGKCYEVTDILDGYAVHDPKCDCWPDTAISGSRCIK